MSRSWSCLGIPISSAASSTPSSNPSRSSRTRCSVSSSGRAMRTARKQTHGASRRKTRLPHRDRIALVSQSFEIGPVQVGAGSLFLIAGPCVIESEAHARKMADAIQRITSDLGVPYIFKASYDKANRTSLNSFRGPGLKDGTAILRRLAEATGLPILTDVHEPSHCEIAAEGADVLQIP